MKVVTTDEMRRIEKAADAGGLSFATMMENAGRAVAEACQRDLGMEPGDRRVLVLVGPGNNGGDGLVAARYFKQAGTQPSVILTGASMVIRGPQMEIIFILFRPTKVHFHSFGSRIKAGLSRS